MTSRADDDRVRDVDVYERRACTSRLVAHPSGRVETVQHGLDAGSALRWTDADGRTRSIVTTGPPPELPGRWPTGSAPDEDVDEDVVEGDAPDAAAVLESLRLPLVRDPAAATALRRLIVEVAEVDERWTDRRGSARRRRHRAWARAELRDGRPPMSVALDPASTLARSGWIDLWVSRTPIEALGGDGGDGEARWLVLSAETAAGLARALEAHWQAGAPRDPVGPGWVVRDDPTDRRGSPAPAFDDACDPTRAIEVADGRGLAPPADPRGRRRRASYRDAPRPAPWHLVVDAPPVTPPAGARGVVGGTWHPLDAHRWTLVDGERSWTLSPGEWTRRCVGGVGPTVTTHLDVSLPGLLFDLA